jgi:hypothetical protein
MKLGRGGAALALALAGAAVFTACSRRKPAEVNPIEPSIAFNRPKVPLGSALEVTYTWKLDPAAKKLGQDYRVMVHFLDSHQQILFDDDHLPTPPATGWEPGKTYTYKRTKFVPIYPYVGPVEVRMGLYSTGARPERVALKGEDVGMNEIKVAALELLPQTDNVYVIEKEGWHSPETAPHNPGQERTWTKREAVAQFKNPKKDLIVYLEADTNAKAFTQPAALTVWLSGGGAAAPAPAAPVKGKPAPPVAASVPGLVVPIENSEIFLKKIRFKAADLGSGDWVDLRLTMNQSFVPKALGLNTDERELGLLVYHLYVGVADQLGEVEGVVDAVPVAKPAAPAPVAAEETKPADPKATKKP